jgi:thiamine monophosphate synthase
VRNAARPAPRLLAITPPHGEIDPSLVSVWLEAGAPAESLAVLLRDPTSPHPFARSERWAALQAECADHGITVLLSCDGEALLAQLRAGQEAPGWVHGFQFRADPSPQLLKGLREALGGTPCLGRSVHGSPTRGDDSIQYSCLAPIFTPGTQDPGHPKRAVGLGRLEQWCTNPPASRKVLALGGVSASTAAACVGAGAHGLAGISAFFSRPLRVAAEVRTLAAALALA